MLLEWMLVIAFAIPGVDDTLHGAVLPGFKTEEACKLVAAQMKDQPMTTKFVSTTGCMSYVPDPTKSKTKA